MNSLFEMGFTENRIKHALHATGNMGAEPAMNWLFEHIEDPKIDEPFDIKVVGNDKNTNNVDAEKLSALANMGFAENVSTKALILNNGNVEASVEWLFSNPDDDGVLEVSQAGDNANIYGEELFKKLESIDNNFTYELMGVICHKGTSVHSGHYVAFIKKDVETEGKKEKKWVLFNDEKVVLASKENIKEIERSGYLYIYKRDD